MFPPIYVGTPILTKFQVNSVFYSLLIVIVGKKNWMCEENEILSHNVCIATHTYSIAIAMAVATVVYSC